MKNRSNQKEEGRSRPNKVTKPQQLSERKSSAAWSMSFNGLTTKAIPPRWLQEAWPEEDPVCGPAVTRGSAPLTKGPSPSSFTRAEASATLRGTALSQPRPGDRHCPQAEGGRGRATTPKPRPSRQQRAGTTGRLGITGRKENKERRGEKHRATAAL